MTITADPLLPGIYTPNGSITVSRVLGLHRAEMELMDVWSRAGFVDSLGPQPRIDWDFSV